MRMQRILSDLWRQSPTTTGVGLLLCLDLFAALLAMSFTHAQILGANAWLKPAKFGISGAVTCLTLAWIASVAKDLPAARRLFDRAFALSLLIEIVVIDLQAFRGTTSHFNVATPLDRVLTYIMGISICVLWSSMVALTWALFRQHIPRSAWAWSLRLGLLISTIAAGGGGLMLHVTPEEKLEQPRLHFGAHTVGAPDGGPGLPVTNWSRVHGDLRIPHFFGLHAMQVIPLIALFLFRLPFVAEEQRTQLVLVASALYFALYIILMRQALLGEALFSPSPSILLLVGTSLFVALLSVGAILRPKRLASFKNWLRDLEVYS